MMSDHQPPDLDPDDVRRLFNDLARTDLAAAPPPMCECKCNGIEPHSDRLCHARATTLVALHRWGWCTELPADVVDVVDKACLDEDGNMTSYMCGRCADHAEAVARRKIALLAASGEPMACPTCGRLTISGADIFTRRNI